MEINTDKLRQKLFAIMDMYPKTHEEPVLEVQVLLEALKAVNELEYEQLGELENMRIQFEGDDHAFV